MESQESSEAWSSLSMPSNVQSLEDSMKVDAPAQSGGEQPRADSDSESSGEEEISSPLKQEEIQPFPASGAGEGDHAASPTQQNKPFGGDVASQSRHSDHQEALAPVGSGNWWSSITSSVKKVAEGVAKDIDELNESFHHMLTELDDPSVDGTPSPHPLERSGAKGEGGAEGSSKGQKEESLTPESAAQRAQVLRRLEGEDTHLEAGLKAFDDQIEQVTGGVSRAIGSLWGTAVAGGASLGQMVAGQPEMAEEGAARGAADEEAGTARQRGNSLLGSLASHAEKTFKALDEKAAKLFDPDTTGPADPGATYAYCWRECGGAQSLEELERLSNECARVCNQRRSRLQEGSRERVDLAFAELAPTFDVQALSSLIGAEATEQGGEAQSTSLHGQAVITALRDAGLQRAEKAGLGHQGRSDLQRHAADEQATQQEEQAAEVQQRLTGVYVEGARVLAEFCGVCVERLHTLGKSLATQARHGRSDGGFHWPPAPLEKGQLLRQQALSLLQDLQALATAFVACLADRLKASEGSEALQSAAEELKTALLQHHSTSIAHIQEAFRALMHVVMLFVNGDFGDDHSTGGKETERNFVFSDPSVSPVRAVDKVPEVA